MSEPSFPRRFRRLLANIALGAVLAILGGAVGWPQSAQFTAALSTVASGLASYNAYGVAVDAFGNVYISDEGNARLLLETNSGGNYTQSDLVSSGAYYYGMSFDAAGNLYVANGGAGNILVFPHGANPSSVVLNVATTGVTSPQDVVLDSSGNLYVTDDGYPTAVDKETSLGGGAYSQTTLIAAPTDAFGVAVDASGNVYATDSAGHVYKETYVSGTTYTLRDAIHRDSKSLWHCLRCHRKSVCHRW